MTTQTLVTEKTVQLEEVQILVSRLAPLDKLKLLERLAKMLEQEFTQLAPLDTLDGLCADLGPGPSIQDIDEVRKAMWTNFPREDF